MIEAIQNFVQGVLTIVGVAVPSVAFLSFIISFLRGTIHDAGS